MVGARSLTSTLIIALASLTWQASHGRSSGSKVFFESRRQSIVSETKSVYRHHESESAPPQMLGRIRFHYDETVSSCHFALLLGVGTFMDVGDYDNLSKALVNNQNLVVVIMDHNVHNLDKRSSTKFASLANEITFQINTLIPPCTQIQPKLMIGGHSAGGQAAMQAWEQGLLSMLPSDVIGFIGLDPYEISDATMANNIMMNLSGLYWGFSTTTCLVSVQKAAKAAYERTMINGRVLYVIHNEKSDSQMTHCIFTDKGCGFYPLGCGTTRNTTFNLIYTMVAESVQLFLQALNHSRPFSRDTFTLPEYSDEKVDVFVNSDLQNIEDQEAPVVL
jgi:hypothetical protein